MTSELKSVRLPCRQIFPIEVWDCIIRTLKHSFPVLLNCRLVCHDWRKITDKVLQQGGLLWNPEFSRNTGEDEETYKEQMKGTRFNSASSIKKFISFASRSSPLLGSNPFPLHSIVIFPTSHDHSDLYLKVPLLLSQFGDEVWHCTYYVNECIPQSILALPVIFQLENLKSITLLSYDWSRGEIEDALKRLDINANLKNLTQVNILGEHAIIPLSILILPNYGSQLKQLYFFCDNDQDQVEKMREKGYSYNVGKYLPNLEKFKVFQPNSELLLSLKECSELKSLSLRTKSQSTANTNLEDLMGGLNALAERLTLIHLQMEPERLGINQVVKPSDKEIINQNVKFPKLTVLNVSFSLFHGAPTFFELIVSKFSGLQEVMFIDCDLDTEKSTASEGITETSDKKGEISQQEFSKMCTPIWLLLPASVKRISMRRWWTVRNEGQDEIFPSTIMTCERKQRKESLS